MSQKQKNKHYDVIVAWASGETIECRTTFSAHWVEIKAPLWDDTVEYRVKSNKWIPKGGSYIVDVIRDDNTKLLGLNRETQVKANYASNEIRRYALLLAYRDEFDPDYTYAKDGNNAYIYKAYDNTWVVGNDYESPDLCKVYMSEEVADVLANKLNSKEVEI